MKQIENYIDDKYSDEEYINVEDGIYKIVDDDEILYVTSLSFIQEPEYNEGEDASDISQYPLEDILDKFYCHISDFYEKLNTEDSSICYQEFASPDIKDVRNLRTIIGKHVYNKEDGKYVTLVIE
ncbi:MAG: hypothetical protein HFJ09_01770 [Lachnospiraceae bacterium]|nr:hypothetical protein [Lachnospiraceae bacterium]